MTSWINGLEEMGYTVLGAIGQGSAATVRKIVHRESATVLAAKVIDLRYLRLRDNFDHSKLRREVDIMQSLTHPSIVKFERVVEFLPDTIVLIMEHLQGKELFDHIVAASPSGLDEVQARTILKQLLSAVAHLHAKNIIHRDIKPENVMLLDGVDELLEGAPASTLDVNKSSMVVKLIDFGLSKMTGQSMAQTFVGTPEYYAPEVNPQYRHRFEEKDIYALHADKYGYGSPADCWSLGVLLFVMLEGHFPSLSENENGELDVNLNSKTSKTNLSSSSLHLIKNLLRIQPSKRLTAAQALQHPWLTQTPLSEVDVNNTSEVDVNFTSPQNVEYSNNNNNDNNTVENNTKNIKKNDRNSNQVLQKEKLENNVVDNNTTTKLIDLNTTTKLMDLNTTTKPMNLNRTIDEESTLKPTVVELGIGLGKYGRYAKNNTDSLDETTTQKPLLTLTKSVANILSLQRTIAKSFEASYAASSVSGSQRMSASIRGCAVLCRGQLQSTVGLFQKLAQTASTVREMAPDLELAVLEGEPSLAHHFFRTVQKWSKAIKESAGDIVKKNGEVLLRVQACMHDISSLTEATSAMKMHSDGHMKSLSTPPITINSSQDDIKEALALLPVVRRYKKAVEEAVHLNVSLTDEQVMELCFPLIKMDIPRISDKKTQINQTCESDGNSSDNSEMNKLQLDKRVSRAASRSRQHTRLGDDHVSLTTLHPQKFTFDLIANDKNNAFDEKEFPIPSSSTEIPLESTPNKSYTTNDNESFEISRNGSLKPIYETTMSTDKIQSTSTDCSKSKFPTPEKAIVSMGTIMRQIPPYSTSNQTYTFIDSSGDIGAKSANTAFKKLSEVDTVLQQFAGFWGNMEIMTDLLVLKNEYVDGLVKFTHKPRLRSLFFERMRQYMDLWQTIWESCREYTHQASIIQTTSYAFLSNDPIKHERIAVG